MKNKRFIFFILLIYSLIMIHCTKDKHIEFERLSNNYVDSSLNHPKNNIFSTLVHKYAKLGYPGFVLCVYDSIDGFWIGSAGKSCIETNEPMEIYNLHHSASISKMYIAAAIFKLYEQDKLDLDSLVKNYLPDDVPAIANINEAKIKNLLNHSSGIYDFVYNPQMYADAINDPFNVNSWKENLNKYVLGKDAFFQVGTSISYSNVNYLLLGLVIEKVTGKCLGDAINDLILQPQGLSETFFKSSLNYPNVQGITNNYFERHEGMIQNCTDIQLQFAKVAMGDEGIIASPRDYVKFLDKLLDNKILHTSTLSLMEEFKVVPKTDIMIGLGLLSFDTPTGRVIGHSGGSFGTMLFLIQLPDKKRTVFFATNLGSIFQCELSDKFNNEVFKEIVECVNY